MQFFRQLLGLDLSRIDSSTYQVEYFQQKNHMLIDVRTPSEFKSGHIEGAKNIPLNSLSSQMKHVPKDKPIIVVCQSGSRSASACRQLMNAGYENVVNLAGGMVGWRMGGNPVK
jgi:phage shock protein E